MNDKDPSTLNHDSEQPDVRLLLEQGRLDDALEIISQVTYDSKEDSSQIIDLKRVIRAISLDESGSPAAALAVFDALVPQPQTSGDTSERDRAARRMASYYDYLIQGLAILALQKKDFATADRVVGRMTDWFVSAAMGGGDLLDEAYAADDPAILASVWALIAKRWGNGRASEAIPTLASEHSFDIDTIDAINGWPDETRIEYRIPR